MKSHFSFTGLSIAVLMFAGTVAMHEAARGKDVFDRSLVPVAKKLAPNGVYTGSFAPVAKKLLPGGVYTGSFAPAAKNLLSDEEEGFEHYGKKGKKGKQNAKHGKKGKHHGKQEGLSTLLGKDLSVLY
jgi:hypothetical protein